MAKVDCAALFKDAWNKLRLGERRRPDEVFPRFTQKDFEEMKDKYVQENGYIISIPKIEDIVHIVPKDLKTPAQIKQEKRQAFSRILASPVTKEGRWYSTMMTVLDDYQDTTSVIYPAIAMMGRIAPKTFGKLLGVLGWIMLAGDLLGLAIGILRLPMTGMGGKRLNCEAVRGNPFSKKARWTRKNRLANYKPGISDLLQVAQTTDNVMGIGLSLGPIMGCVMDSLFGAYRYITGEPVRFAYGVPDAFEYEKNAARAVKSAGLIATQGQTFDEETHFWSLVMGAVGGRLFFPFCYENQVAGAAEDPMSIMVPAPYPTDPITIEVIKESGLDVDQGYGWWINGKPEIPLGDLTDYMVEHAQEGVINYWRRHDKDWYGWVSSQFWDQMLPVAIEAFDSSGESFWEDSEISRVVFTMLKAPYGPTRNMTNREKELFFDWVMTYREIEGHPPGLIAIKEKFELMGIPCRESYPLTREPEADLLFPKDFDLSPYLLY